MPRRTFLVCLAALCLLVAARSARADHFGFDSNGVTVINYSRKAFPIGFTLPPPPTAGEA